MKRADAQITAALREASPDLLTYLQRRVGVADAPDLLGETMVVAWRRVDELPEDPERARMWLLGVGGGRWLIVSADIQPAAARPRPPMRAPMCAMQSIASTLILRNSCASSTGIA